MNRCSVDDVDKSMKIKRLTNRKMLDKILSDLAHRRKMMYIHVTDEAHRQIGDRIQQLGSNSSHTVRIYVKGFG